MEGKINLFDVLNNTMTYIRAKNPSNLLPFKGDLPIIKPWQEDLFREGTNGKHWLEECDDWIQRVLIKAQRIADIDNGFREYLYNNGIHHEYFKMNGEKKVVEIKRFLDSNSLTIDDLIITNDDAME